MLLFVLVPFYGFTQQDRQVLPTTEQQEWANAEIGVIIHLGMNIFAPDSYHDGQKQTLPPLSSFHPSKLNTDQWISAAKSAGAKYAVLVVKHNTGFSLWPTKVHDYNISNTPWKNGKGDVLADFLASCKKYGIRPGIYCSVNNNTYLGAAADAPMTDSVRRAYNKMVLSQLTELYTQYGRFFEIWYDGGILPSDKGGVSNEIAQLINKEQPQAILFQGPMACKNLIRWVGNEYGNAPYPMWSRTNVVTSSDGRVEVKGLNGDPDGSIWCPGEADFPSRRNSSWEGGWFWRANREQDVLPVSDLVDKYYCSVGRNANMLIGMAIDTSGAFPAKETAVFKEFGLEIKRRFSSVIAETIGEGNEITLNLGRKPRQVNQIVLMENIAKGENVRKYNVEAWLNSKWKIICEGSSIGHKRIQTFPTVNTRKLRLHVIAFSGPIRIKEIIFYNKTEK